jgi:hypothetical protein
MASPYRILQRRISFRAGNPLASFEKNIFVVRKYRLSELDLQLSA